MPNFKNGQRPIDEIAQRHYSWWGKSFVFIKKAEVKTWQAIFIVAFISGICATLIWTVSNNIHPYSSAASTQPSITISACGEITQPGSYNLSQDLVPSTFSSVACLYIHDTQNVFLNCNNHSITGSSTGIKFQNVNNFSLNLCNVDPLNVYSVSIVGSSDGEISNNSFNKNNWMAFNVVGSSNLNIHNNFFGASYQQNLTNGTILKNNTFINNEHILFAPNSIISTLSYNNVFSDNIIDGRAKGLVTEKKGNDDGILINDDHDDLIQNNNIKNVRTGIETAGNIVNSRFINNVITNAAYCGIGGWWDNSWQGNTVSNNTVSNSPCLFFFTHSLGLRPKGWYDGTIPEADQGIYFRNNVFSGNKFTPRSYDPNETSINGSLFNIVMPLQAGNGPGVVMPTQDQIIVGNNLFADNDFSTTIYAPVFFPNPGLVTDGGRNICSVPVQPNYPLKCNSAPTITITSPNGRENFIQGQVNKISWKGPSSLTLPYTNIGLYGQAGKGAFVGFIYGNSWIGTGSYSWDAKRVCSGFSNSVASGCFAVKPGSYRIGVLLGDGSIFDLSDNPFTITSVQPSPTPYSTPSPAPSPF